MKGFKKLALASAIATLPVSGFAMEALDDATLSGVTGQDGITISIASVAFDAIRVDDSDGFTYGDPLSPTNSSAANGAIFIKGFSMSGATTVVVDADTDTLQAAITLGSGTMNLGSIAVGTYQSTALPAADVITLGTMTHGDISLNVQLGTEDQGDMIALNGIVTGGLSLTGFSIRDTDDQLGAGVAGGAITMDLTVVSHNDTDLNLSGSINVDNNNLVISGLGAMDVTMGNLVLGTRSTVYDPLTDDPAIGDVSILNLQIGDITISGH